MSFPLFYQLWTALRSGSIDLTAIRGRKNDDHDDDTPKRPTLTQADILEIRRQKELEELDHIWGLTDSPNQPKADDVFSYADFFGLSKKTQKLMRWIAAGCLIALAFAISYGLNTLLLPGQ